MNDSVAANTLNLEHSGRTIPSESVPERGTAAQHRDVGLDVLRGIAVVIMVGANLAPHCLPHDYPFWFRAWASLAAPLFIALSGFVTGRAGGHRARSWSHSLKRAMALLCFAAFIDLACWEITPFTNFDVLYLVALLQVAAHALLKSGPLVTLGSSLVLIALATPVQQLLGYGRIQGHWGLDRLQSWLVDGWFPVFPWLGLGLLGVYFGRIGSLLDDVRLRRRLLLVGSLMLFGGAAWWRYWPPETAVRGGYAELFYPPTLAFLVPCLGFLCIAATTIPYLRRCHELGGLALLGRRALLVYVVHLVLIGRVMRPHFGAGTAIRFGLCYLGLLTFSWAIAVGASKLWPCPRTFIARLLFG